MQKQAIISTRIPKQMAEEIEGLSGEFFTNSADFFRTALRDEIFKLRLMRIRKEYARDKDSVKAVRKLRKLTTKLSDEEYEKWVQEAIKDMP